MKTSEVVQAPVPGSKEHLPKNKPKAIGSQIAEEHLEQIKSMVKEPVEQAAKVELSSKAKELNKIGREPGVKKPAIFFIRGFEVFSSDGGGLREMSKSIKGAEYFSWRDEEKIIHEIKKRSLGQPVVLVGYGMGGDTAVNISNTLNSPSHGFRKVNLLVTMDSVGVNNDIIPQNVAKNLNFISDEGGMFSDGPNIARKTEHTDVVNFLQDDGDMVESSDVQFKIFDSINEALFKAS